MEVATVPIFWKLNPCENSGRVEWLRRIGYGIDIPHVLTGNWMSRTVFSPSGKVLGSAEADPSQEKDLSDYVAELDLAAK